MLLFVAGRVSRRFPFVLTGGLVTCCQLIGEARFVALHNENGDDHAGHWSVSAAGFAAPKLNASCT